MDFDSAGARPVDHAVRGGASSARPTRGTPGSRGMVEPLEPRHALRCERTVCVSRREGGVTSRDVGPSRCRWDACCTRLLLRRSRRASASAVAGRARRALPVVAPEGRGVRRRYSTAPSAAWKTSRRVRGACASPVVGLAVNMMTKRNVLQIVARAAGACVAGGPILSHYARNTGRVADGSIGEGEQMRRAAADLAERGIKRATGRCRGSLG